MKSILRISTLAFSSLLLAACSGGGSGSVDDTISSTNSSIGGLWSGPATAIDGSSTYDLFGAATEDGRFIFLSEFGLDIGKIDTTGTNFDGSFDSYSLSGTQVAGLLAGSITERQSLTGTILTSDNIEAGTFELEYDDAYTASTTLADIAGIYSMSLSGFTETYSFDEEGNFLGSDTNGCVYAGNLSIIDERYSVLDINGEVSGCVDVATKFTGLAAFERANGDFNDFLVAGGAGENGAFITFLEKTN